MRVLQALLFNWISQDDMLDLAILKELGYEG